MLKDKGYDIKVLDLIDMEKSDCYNPFVYIHNDNDIQRLVTNLFKNTTPKGSQSTDPFWDQAASMLLKALISFLHYEAPPEEQNFSMILELIRAADIPEEQTDFEITSPLDDIFARLEAQKPDHIALKYPVPLFVKSAVSPLNDVFTFPVPELLIFRRSEWTVKLAFPVPELVKVVSFDSILLSKDPTPELKMVTLSDFSWLIFRWHTPETLMFSSADCRNGASNFETPLIVMALR